MSWVEVWNDLTTSGINSLISQSYKSNQSHLNEKDSPRRDSNPQPFGSKPNALPLRYWNLRIFALKFRITMMMQHCWCCCLLFLSLCCCSLSRFVVELWRGCKQWLNPLEYPCRFKWRWCTPFFNQRWSSRVDRNGVLGTALQHVLLILHSLSNLSEFQKFLAQNQEEWK